MEQEEKICKNYRYYMRHYIYAHTFFMGLSEGHCLKHKNFGKRSNNKFEINDTCENWESDEIRKIKTKEDILIKLEKMCENISYIAQILKEDNGKDANT